MALLSKHLRNLLGTKYAASSSSTGQFSPKAFFSSQDITDTEEEIPQNLTKKRLLNMRSFRSHYVVYACGLTKTGSLAIPNFIKIKATPEAAHSPKVITLMKGKKVRKVAAGFGFSLFASNKELYGSGLNNFYQIGGPLRREEGTNGAHDWYYKPRSIPLHLDETETIVSIGAGRLHSIVCTEKRVFCFGSNTHGQCGADPEKHYLIAHNNSLGLRSVPIPDKSPIKQVHCCLDTSFVLLENGRVYAWGLGTDGQLGNGESELQFQPALVTGDIQDVKIISLDGNSDTILACSEAGEVFMWGQNEYGQLKVLTDDTQVFYPRHVPFKLGRVMSAAATSSSCIVSNSEGEVFTWGSQVLGFGPKVEYLERPMQIDPPLFQSATKDGGFVERVFAGGCTMAALTKDKHLYVWGANRHGVLGLGHFDHQYFPIQLHLPYPIRMLSFGPDHTLFATK